MIEDNFIKLVTPHIGGSPMEEGVLWTNQSRAELSRKMAELGTPASTNLIKRLLKKHKIGQRHVAKKKTMGAHPDRNAQFENIAKLVKAHQQAGHPVISIDTKKKELLGDFARAGTVLSNVEVTANDHDFPSSAEGKLTPHGIYDVNQNQGFLNLTTSHDTSEFCCDSVEWWWNHHGKHRYGHASECLILCDGGGSNAARSHLFKESLQSLANKIQKTIRIAHYPPYCSKYNPIEHRLFPHVTRACQGVVLHTVETAQYFMAQTKTQTGLAVVVNTCAKVYETGKKCTKAFLENMPIVFDAFLPQWNYQAVPKHDPNLEVIL